jgi:hypothetical protein
VTGPFATAIIVASLLLSLWTLVLVIANRPPGRSLWFALGGLEVLLLVFLVDGIVQMIGSDRDVARLEFVLYLLACAAVVPRPPGGCAARCPGAAGVLHGGLLVLPVMIVRVSLGGSGG